jgi:hypothetical protein
MRPCSRIYYYKVFNCSTCFEWHTAHHQEIKYCNCSLWFYVRLWLPATVMAEWFPLNHDSCRQPQMNVKPEAVITIFELLMMSGVSLETCWAFNKLWNNKFYYKSAPFWYFYWSTMVTIGTRWFKHFKAYWSRDAPTCLTFKDCTLWPRCIYHHHHHHKH